MASSSGNPVKRLSHRHSLWQLPGICLVASSCSLVMQSGINIPAERKVVVDKEAPNRLIARDQTQCTVPDNRFESLAIGATVSCVWFEVP